MNIIALVLRALQVRSTPLPSTLTPNNPLTHALTAPLRRRHPRPLHNANKGPILRLRALANRLQRLRRWMGTTRRAGRHPRYDRLRRA